MKKATTYNVGNTGRGMVQTQTYSWVNPLHGIATLVLSILLHSP